MQHYVACFFIMIHCQKGIMQFNVVNHSNKFQQQLLNQAKTHILPVSPQFEAVLQQ